ncbi:MAG: hypothetical protein ACK56I_13935, partial [bacterium]
NRSRMVSSTWGVTAYRDAGHDPITVIHANRLLHRPESPFDNDAELVKFASCFIQAIGASVNALHGTAIRAHEGP